MTADPRLIIFAVVMTMLGALGGLFLKKASGFKKVFDLFFCGYFYLGGLLYFSAALLNIYVLRFWDYSFVLPFTSVTYIWTLLLSHYVLKENVTRKNIIGVAGVIAGVVLIAM